MAKPILDIHCITVPGCKYPVAVKILMDDNTAQLYTLDSAMSPKVIKAKADFEHSLEISIGYQYRPKRKDRIHRGKR